MQVIEIINQARTASNEKSQFTNAQLVGFLNKGISEINKTLSVNFPIIPQPYDSQLILSLQELPATVDNVVVYPFALFDDSLQYNTLVNYIAYSILLAKRDDYNMVFKNAFDEGVRFLMSSFTFDYTNKFRSRVTRLHFGS